jgi:hypothetical protein
MAVRITSIKKDNGNHVNPYEAISAYGWMNEKNGNTGLTNRPTMVDWIENKNGHAYVRSSEGTVDCYVNISRAGTKFLQTNADDRSSNNLLNLPEHK